MPASFFFATGTTVPFSKYAIYCAAAVEAQVGNSAAEVLRASSTVRREANILRGEIDTFLTTSGRRDCPPFRGARSASEPRISRFSARDCAPEGSMLSHRPGMTSWLVQALHRAASSPHFFDWRGVVPAFKPKLWT